MASGGTADVGPDQTMGEGFPLGRWVHDMRGRKAAGELDGEQVAALEQLPGWRWG
ncbi:MAG: helicase associated domain-containing protein [Actinomycetota bacterium]|nr:helicase associated domain-containing protein [Actinomycetota bacterium]